eukprot:5766739-Prymnesium_polylepis.1
MVGVVVLKKNQHRVLLCAGRFWSFCWVSCCYRTLRRSLRRHSYGLPYTLLRSAAPPRSVGRCKRSMLCSSSAMPSV